MSEIFPMEVRAKAIAVFFAIAQGFGALGPVIYGHLIGDGSDPAKLTVADSVTGLTAGAAAAMSDVTGRTQSGTISG